ncbi:hypothetical protein Q5P01_015323 [Channa striata]|uniref:SH2 domain containing 3Cb n=1 Tax=Channa striata TaxID=64152 RepID=A0AA88MH70_CHASR|nr:hypothetical protein Q5P01_015323 [Channa striata]
MNKRKKSFRWFGSLTNLSPCRSPQKAKLKAAPGHDGRSAEAEEPSLDDAKVGVTSPGYACTSHMYTHVGTVPRSERHKLGLRGQKEKTKTGGQGEGGSGGQSQWQAEEHVRDSPLLSALSSLSLTGLDQPVLMSALARPLPATPLLGRASPLTSTPRSCDGDPSGGPADTKDALEPLGRAGELSNMAHISPKVVSSQDVYVPMSRISETARQETSGTVNILLQVATADGERDVTDGSGDYVKFSKEKFWLEPPSETLMKQLEEELKLSSSDLKSHAWYHGCIPCEVSESLVVNHGDFLIRDSQSSQGDFVLTSHWEQKTLHFLISKMVVQSSETRADLTQGSGAQIHRPVNRTLPLSHLETAFGTAVGQKSWDRGLINANMSGEERVCPRSPSSLHHREANVNRRQNVQAPPTAAEAAGSASCHNNTPLSKSPCSSRPASAAPSPSLSRRSDTARPLLSPKNTRQTQYSDRPQLHLNHDPSSSDTDGNCYTELYPGPQSYVERLQADEGSVGVNPLRVEDGNMYFSPVVETVSSFKPSRYQSPLMPKENKPLEVGILRRVKELLAEIDPRTAAKHITKADCMVARILEVTPEVQRRMGVSSGMELLTLPHGQRLRLDLLERFQTMATMLALDVLGCTGTNEERASLLHKIIQIAAELKSTMGNMFGFAAVMRALELPQVARLEETWTALRQRHTEGAILYEKTLRPFMKSLNEGRESCPLSNTTFPHVLPLLSLFEKSVAVGEGTELWETADVGVDVVMFHLGAARTIAQLGGIYRSNAESKLQGFQEQAEVLEIFVTDFQMRLLWGSRGAEEMPALRHAKFDQVLTALSNKLEPPVRTQ